MEYIKYMNSRTSLMTIVPAAGLIPLQATGHAKALVADRVSNDALACGGNCDLPGASWLVTEDEYFPFDADSFEER